MTDAPSSEAETAPARDRDRDLAYVVYGLYLLSIPSVGILALIGAILAYVRRDRAGDLAHAHFNEQLRIFWIAVWWSVGLALLSVVAWALTLVLIGFLALWGIAIAFFLVGVWFVVRSLLGLARLARGERP